MGKKEDKEAKRQEEERAIRKAEKRRREEKRQSNDDVLRQERKREGKHREDSIRSSRTGESLRREDEGRASKPSIKKPQPLPEDLGFLWRIEEVEPQVIRPVGLSKHGDNAVYKTLLPSNSKADFHSVPGQYPIYQWRANGSREVSVAQTLKPHSTASVFYNSRHDNFLAVPWDCREFDVAGWDIGWTGLGFQHTAKQCSILCLGKDVHDVLAVPAHGTSWMPQLIPQTYSPSIYGRHARKNPSPGCGGLCGDLSLLVALAAFSAHEDHSQHVVKTSFLKGQWLSHQYKSGRYEHRCIVASIWEDPTSPETRKEHLTKWEKGTYGPIFTHHGVGSDSTAPGRIFGQESRSALMSDDIDDSYRPYSAASPYPQSNPRNTTPRTFYGQSNEVADIYDVSDGEAFESDVSVHGDERYYDDDGGDMEIED